MTCWRISEPGIEPTPSTGSSRWDFIKSVLSTKFHDTKSVFDHMTVILWAFSDNNKPLSLTDLDLAPYLSKLRSEITSQRLQNWFPGSFWKSFFNESKYLTSAILLLLPLLRSDLVQGCRNRKWTNRGFLFSGHRRRRLADPMEVEGPLEAAEAGADIATKLHGVLVEELSPIQTTLQVLV